MARTINTRTKYVLIGSDFSQQEPRLLSHYSQDENMITAYKQGKDLYATIASGVYKMGYWDCMERYEDGSPNPEGKKRRQSVKAILLGIMYGRGARAIAEQIGSTVERAQEIVDDIVIGWNLGNTLEEFKSEISDDPYFYETPCAQPITTKKMILDVKEAGFNAIRLPVTWYQKLDENNNIIDYDTEMSIIQSLES